MENRRGAAPPGGCFYQVPDELARRRDLTASAKIVLGFLRFRQGRKDACWPGVRRIATACGIGVTTAARCIAALESKGLIDVDHGNLSTANRYQIGHVTKTGTLPKRARNVPESGTPTLPKRVQKRREQEDSPTTARKAKSVIWNNGEQRFEVTAEQLARWRRDFPDKDVEAELRKAGAHHASVLAEGGKRKPWVRFQSAITRWLGRPNRAPGRQGQGKGRFQQAGADHSQYDNVTIHSKGQANEQRG